MIFKISLSVLVCLACLSGARAVSPPPDGCYPNYTTAEGCNALSLLSSGAGNTGVGWYALFSAGASNFNTAVGAGALVLNTGDSNTAVGGAALLLNTAGTENTAVGTDALVFNDAGVGNTATGFKALFANTTGLNNVASGVAPLASNIGGNGNTAIGNLALFANTSGSDNVALGRHAGVDITGASNNIVIGHLTGVHSRFGQEDNRCYIENIYGVAVDNAGGIARIVYVDPDGRLGTALLADGPALGKSKGVQRQTPDAESMLNRKVEALETTVAQLREQLKEQAVQIQKVSAQLQTGNAAPQLVTIKP
jgi:hypothetical protein